MARIAIFHHALGRTDGMRALARRFESVGHTVTMPDAYGGRTFASLDDGLQHLEALGGVGACTQRFVEALSDAPDGVVYLGVSLGVVAAQVLAQTRRGARAAVLVSACVPYEALSPSWPADVPVQVHAMEDDAIFRGDGDAQAARDLVAHACNARSFTYPGSAHVWCDESVDGFDAMATHRLVEHTSALVNGGRT